jgi:hypothetical protein
MKLKKQQMIFLVAIVIVVILIGTVAVILNTGDGGTYNEKGNGNDNGSNGGTNGGINGGDGNGDNGGGSQLTGSWINLSNNINPVSSLYEEYGYTDFLDVFFINEREGWVTSGSVPEIYHTTDGGQTWEMQTTQLSCEAIWMLDENEGYAGGKSGFVYRTIDGGDNWIYHGTIGATLLDITFPRTGNTDTGYACGFNGAISSINSSGVTPMNSGVNNHVYGLSFPTYETGWMCAGPIIKRFVSGSWIADQVHNIYVYYSSIWFWCFKRWYFCVGVKRLV